MITVQLRGHGKAVLDSADFDNESLAMAHTKTLMATPGTYKIVARHSSGQPCWRWKTGQKFVQFHEDYDSPLKNEAEGAKAAAAAEKKAAAAKALEEFKAQGKAMSFTVTLTLNEQDSDDVALDEFAASIQMQTPVKYFRDVLADWLTEGQPFSDDGLVIDYVIEEVEA